MLKHNTKNKFRISDGLPKSVSFRRMHSLAEQSVSQFESLLAWSAMTISPEKIAQLWLETDKNGSPCFYTFEACSPEDVIYRLDYRNSVQKDEYIQMLKDFGQDYFTQCFKWICFRKTANSVEEERTANFSRTMYPGKNL